MKIAKRTVWLSMLAGLCSCLQPLGEYVKIMEYKENTPLPERIYFNYSNSDTLSLKDIVLTLQYTEKYGYDRIRFRVECLSPKNYWWTDTLAFELFDSENRRFEDEKAASRYNWERCIIERALFKELGVYRMTLIPVTEVTGVTAIGLVIKKRE